MRLTLAFALALLTSTALAFMPRPVQSLNGPWSYVKVPDLNWPAPDDGWRDIQVPGCLDGFRYERAWFRRTAPIPAAWQGKRLKLRLAGCKYSPIVYVNGQKVGAHVGGYEPAEFDITAAAKPGADNIFVVGVHDWTGIFVGDPVKFPERIGWDDLRGLPVDHAQYPIGGQYNLYGFWDDVSLYAVPAVYLAEVAIVTKVSSRTLSVICTVANEGDRTASVSVAPDVLDAGKTVLSLSPRSATLQPGQQSRVAFEAKWQPNQVKLWSPESPKLYFLRTSVKAAGTTDERNDRFGFREISVKGPDFYLNGVKRHLLGSSTWPMPQSTHDEVADVLRRLKSANVISFRTHTQPWREIWYDVADEVGLCMIPEAAVWNDDTTYRLDDPVFWENWGNHLRATVHNLGNHPSIIMWSLENEFAGGRAKAGSVYERRLADLGRLVKSEDPTRPIYYESDGDPGGVADVMGLHYPNEPPGVRRWPPEAYWMDKPRHFPKDWIFLPHEDWKWDRKKPLYIGEYLWYPAGTPADYTVFLGDEAYRSLDSARNDAKAAVWRWQTLAYRHYGVSGLCPWTLFEGGPLDPKENPIMAAQAKAMQPLAAYCRQEFRRAYSGQPISFTLEIFNDLPAEVRGTLRWALLDGAKTLDSGGMGLVLEPAQHVEAPLVFLAPKVTARRDCVLRLTIEREGGARVFSDERPFTIWPVPAFSQPTAPLLVHDPSGMTARTLADRGLRCQEVADLAALPAAPDAVLILGENAFGAPSYKSRSPWGNGDVATKLDAFVRAGGRLIVLRQPDYPGGILPASLDVNARSTMAFLQQPTHPLLAGLPVDAFMFWVPDHNVTAGEVLRPTSGGFVPLVVTGFPDGVSHCALLEAPRGKGTYLFCQLPVVERLKVEPMAVELLKRMITYAAAYKGSASPALVLGADQAYRQNLADMGLSYDAADSAAGIAAPKTPVVVVRGAAPGIDGLADWIRQGGTLLLDRPSPEVLAAAGKLAGVSLRVSPYAGPCLRASGADPLAGSILREDLYWIGKPVGVSWTNQPLATDTADGALGIDFDFKPLQTFQAADMKYEGGLVALDGDHITMATVGTARVKTSVPADGLYALGVDSMGTPCDGGYPLAEIRLDGKSIGTISATAAYARVTVLAPMTAGDHEISVSFTNDASSPTEDRNYFLRSVAVGPAPDQASRVTPIAMGPTSAYLKLAQGRIVLNLLRWDTNGDNTLRGRRYFASLLTALGADFVDTVGVAYALDQFKPMPDYAWFSNNAGFAAMACNGWIEGEIEVPRDGAYHFGLEASGTPCEGELPEAVVAIDGKDAADIHLATGQWRSYAFDARLAPGKHTVRISFVNDKNAPGEDRNLAVRRLTISEAPRP
jgi:beta-galactosidase